MLGAILLLCCSSAGLWAYVQKLMPAPTARRGALVGAADGALGVVAPAKGGTVGGDDAQAHAAMLPKKNGGKKKGRKEGNRPRQKKQEYSKAMVIDPDEDDPTAFGRCPIAPNFPLAPWPQCQMPHGPMAPWPQCPMPHARCPSFARVTPRPPTVANCMPDSHMRCCCVRLQSCERRGSHCR